MGEPKLRFKADDGSEFPDWEDKTLGELFTFVTEKNKDSHINNVITNSAERGLVPQREYFDKDIAVDGNTKGYTVIRKGISFITQESRQVPHLGRSTFMSGMRLASCLLCTRVSLPTMMRWHHIFHGTSRPTDGIRI